MNIHVCRFVSALLMLFGASALAEQPRPSWGGEPNKATPDKSFGQPTPSGQSGTRTPPPPPTSGQKQSSSALPPRPPGVGIQSYDPLGMRVEFRTVGIGWDFSKVDVMNSERQVVLSEDSSISVFFFRPGAELPQGAYTAGIVLETQGAPFDGLIQIIPYTGTAGAPVFKECPVTAGTVTCYGSGAISPTYRMLRIQLVRHQGSKASYNNPIVKKILADVPN